MSKKPMLVPHVAPASGGFRAGWYRPNAPGRAIPEDGGKEPPPAPVNHSSGGRETSPAPGAQRMREATARNVQQHDASLSPRRFSWERDQ